MKNLNDFIKGCKVGFENFGKTLGTVVNSALLLLVYLFGVGLTSVFARLFRKHFLELKKRKTYWRQLNLGKRPTEEYYRQF